MCIPHRICLRAIHISIRNHLNNLTACYFPGMLDLRTPIGSVSGLNVTAIPFQPDSWMFLESLMNPTDLDIDNTVVTSSRAALNGC